MAIEIAVIGATGNVGRKVVDMLLSNPLISSCKLTLFASSESAGKTLEIKGVSYPILDTKKANFSQFNLCIFNTESEVSAQFIPPALQAGAYVVDSSAHFRLQQDVPLIVPPVNLALIDLNSRLYAHANCVVSPIATTIKPLHDRFPILRINAVTFQSTSGAGKAASDECLNETAALIKQEPYQRTHFDKQIAFNVIPQVGSIMQDGATTEEFKIIHEVKKIVNPAIAVTATAVRVPVMVGHSIALSVEFTESIEQRDIETILKDSPAVKYYGQGYATPVDVVDTDEVSVGRLRRDHSRPNAFHLWLCSDNLRRGAATDSVEITHRLIDLLAKK